MNIEKINKINTLALASIDKMRCPERMLLMEKIVKDGDEGIHLDQHINTRYTAMCLIGLHHAARSGLRHSIPIAGILDRYYSIFNQLADDELGLFLWVNALYKKLPAPDLLSIIERRLPSFSTGFLKSMTLAWLLTGLTLTYELENASVIRKKAEEFKIQLLRLYNPSTSLFRAGSFIKRRNVIRSMREYKLGSFAAQIYPVYALAKYAKVFGDDQVLRTARACAGKLVELQGPMGQWWWIYHTGRGKVVEKYPVFAVHQDGMAPMALFALQEATGENYEDAIGKGLDWIYGQNELGVSLVDERNQVIWRAIKRKEPGKEYSFGMGLSGHINASLAAISGGLNLQWIHDRLWNFEILYESRSYHAGWILAAFADKK